MKKTTSSVLAAAVTGLLMGSTTGCAGSSENATSQSTVLTDKHICRGHNACNGKGGCATGDQGCAGKNTCEGKGGCPSMEARHNCRGHNACKGLGGCSSGDNGCAGKNSCKGNGGCKVPLKHN